MSGSESSNSVFDESDIEENTGPAGNQGHNMFDQGEEGTGGTGPAAGVVPGNFLATVFLTIHISSNAIVTYLRLIPIPFYRMFVYCLISLDIANELSQRGLEVDPVSRRFIGHSPRVLRRNIEDLIAALEEIDQGHPRDMMYGIVMRIIAELAYLL